MTEFEATEKLYHFTNFEAACKILASKTLLLSSLSGLNDVNESFRTIYSRDLDKSLSWKDLESKFRQLSLSEDKDGALGFLNLPMWGNYADKGKGACIVLDKNKFIRELDKQGLWHGEIDYVDKYDNDLIISSEEDIVRNHRIIFFQKDSTWRFEQEYRVVGYNTALKSVDISACLKWVIMYCMGEDSIFNTAEYKALAQILGKERVDDILAYGRFLNEESLTDSSGGNPVWSRELD
ncbi:MAG: DUF2971 domain-containing protein [Muribaculaceae bacterium]|nr:DUF2971 domain-containing protein [Muribaculaceae bacterium]